MVLLLRSVLSDHGKKEYFDLFERMVRDIENLSVSTDRARQTVFGTTVEHLEHLPERIRGGNTSEEPLWDRYSGRFGYFS